MTPRLKRGQRGGSRLYAGAMLAPMRSLGELTLPAWVVATGVGFVNFLRSDIIVGGLVLAALLGLADYLVGYTRAKIQGCHDPRIAQLGLLSKLAGIVLVLGTRTMEWWLQTMVPPWPDTDGLIAAVLCAALVIRELHSLNEKGVKLPLVTRALDGIESVLARLLPPAPAPPPRGGA